MTDITAIILTKNEEVNIQRCIQSVANVADRIVVVDSGSTDKTVEIAASLGAEIFHHPFEHYAAQFNWAVENTHITTTWVYRIDADECVTEALAKEIVQKCAENRDTDVNAFLMKHKLYFLGRYLTHGGAYPFLKITVYKPQFASFENRAMGEHVVVHQGRYEQFENDCLHYDCKDLNSFIEKHNWYATREVKDYFDRLHRENQQADLYQDAQATKKLRDGLYYRLPKFLRAKLYYIYRYYFQLGFLDGTPGRIFAFVQSYFYRYTVDAKIYEQELAQKEEK